MFTPRRLYIYLVSAISLQAFAWAIIDLIRSLLITPFNASSIALAWNIAIIIVSLPVYLVHWLWGQRIVNRDREEREASIRSLYLYGMQAAFLGPIIASTFGLVYTLLLWIAGQPPTRHYPELNSSEAILFYMVPMLVLGLLWFYHQRIIQQDSTEVKLRGGAATIRRLYVLSFSAVGLAMTTMGFMYLIRWLMFQIGGGDTIGVYRSVGFMSEVARLIVGIPLWLAFWLWAQRLFYGEEDEERSSALRKFYLYAVILVAVISTVTSITYILEGLFSLVLGGSTAGASDGDVRIPISIIIPMVVLWIYHSRVLKADIKVAEEVERQSGLRRLYYYLIAAIGLSAFLVGISGILSVLIRSLDQASFGPGLNQQLSWFAAVSIAGLPVWYLPWRQSQIRASDDEIVGIGERESIVRRFYIYIFMFIATMTILISIVYIVYGIISMVLGETPPTLSDLGQPVAFSIIAVIVLLYHRSVLRTDRQRLPQDKKSKYKETTVLVAGYGENEFSKSVIEELGTTNLPITLGYIDLKPSPTKSTDLEETRDMTPEINQAKIIIAPWEIVIAGRNRSVIVSKLARTIIDSPARKLLVPSQLLVSKSSEEWDLFGVAQWNTSTFVGPIVNSVIRILKVNN